MKKNILSLYFFVFLLLSSLINAQDNETQEQFANVIDIANNPKWLDNETIDLSLDRNSYIVFDFEYERCEISVSSFDKYTGQNALLSLKCGNAPPQPINLKRDNTKKLDLNYNKINDISLLLKSFAKQEDKFILAIGRISGEENSSSGIFVLIFLTILVGFGIFYFFYHKSSREKYTKIKGMIENLENYLALKEHEDAKTMYNDIKDLYKKLTLNKQKELYNEINELFKQFEREESNSREKL